MRKLLTLFFLTMFLVMLSVTVWATRDRGMLEAGAELLEFPWFIATLTDAYLAFFAFYAWLAWREGSWTARLVWLILIVCLGSMAIAIYMLWQLYRRRGQPVAMIWQRG